MYPVNFRACPIGWPSNQGGKTQIWTKAKINATIELLEWIRFFNFFDFFKPKKRCKNE